LFFNPNLHIFRYFQTIFVKFVPILTKNILNVCENPINEKLTWFFSRIWIRKKSGSGSEKKPGFALIRIEIRIRIGQTAKINHLICYVSIETTRRQFEAFPC